ncbi:hypothetical protein ACFPN2_05035 [Steroidobacter flavus]|uniref:Uncharacterized protein n=1 Tax=Steroidobacter flavus TaxID=1842136 RepID=A0ABV8SPK6_9GAMM
MNSAPDFYPTDIDCAWLASDADGVVAMFLTAGRAPVPERCFDNAGAPLEEIEEQLMRMEPCYKARLLVPVKRPEGYMDAAHRGFVVYDWTDVHKTRATKTHSYERVAVPENPLRVDALPSPLALAAKAVRLDGISFATTSWIPTAALHPYRARPKE